MGCCENLNPCDVNYLPLRLWKRFQDSRSVRSYSKSHPRITANNDGRYFAITAKRSKRSTSSNKSRQLSSATGTTVSRKTMYKRLGHFVLHAHRPVRCVPLTTTHCRQRLGLSRKHAMRT
ncbi:transposable element Tcb1 transposase [Trichonephila clavipes]|nr:transposable element Tcb1 transposase [Trichonephila clavipes]